LARNIYVLDTCVLVHDPNAIFKFAEHDVYIPLTVIDELDKFKDEVGRRGWSAREFFRIYDALDTDAMHDPKKGAKLGDKGGKLFVFNTELRLQRQTEAGSLSSKLADNVIIRSTQQIKEDNERRKVVLVTKDRGLLIRARGWEINAENYRNDLVQETAYTGMREVQIDSNADWDVLWNSGDEVNVSKLSEAVREKLTTVNPHEAVIFAWGESKFPALHKGAGRFVPLGSVKMEFMGIKPKNLEQRVAMALLADTSIPFVTLSGAAGTGKTMSALAVSLHQVANEEFDRILFMKPVVPVGGKDIGFLPGSKLEKLMAWLGPLSDNIDQIVGRTSLDGSRPVEKLIADNKVEAEAMTYIQGRSIARTIIIVDEAENIKPREARMVVERCGPGSRVIFLGDLSQIEDPYLDRRSNGLAHAIEGGKAHPLSASVTLSDVVRSPLAAAASEIFSRPEAQR
jgi:PhoH-like ATPase